MKARAIALAVPLALGAACTHQTGAMSRPSEEERQAAAGGAAGGAAAQDPMMKPGPTIQGHAGDQIVSGEVADATGTSVTVRTPQGDARTLQIVPETAIEVDGQDAAAGDLAEGQPVRASFDVVEGQEVAVKIRAGAATGAGGDAGSQGTGSSAPEPPAVDPAAPAPADPGSAAPDAGWGPPGSGGEPAGPGAPRP